MPLIALSLRSSRARAPALSVAVLIVAGCAAGPPRPEMPVASQSAPVVALLDRADAELAAGRAESAAATLERALRIEPTNARLWHRLARVRLAQGLAEEAEGLAARSRSLATDSPALQAANWRLIAHARRRHGDEDGAAAAEARARELEGR